MKRKFQLTEADIKAAILMWVVREANITDSHGLSIRLTATQSRDQMDRPTYGYDVTAEVEEK